MKYKQAIEDLQNSDKIRRMEAAEYLGNMGTDETLNHLLNALGDKDSEVRYMVVKGISHFNNNRVLRELMKSLKDPVWYVRTLAGIELEKKLGKESESILEFFIENDPSKLSKLFSIYALLMLNPSKSKDYIGTILNYLRDSEEEIKVQSLMILGDIGRLDDKLSSDLLKELLKALKDKRSNVKKAAIKALLKLKTDGVKNYLLKMIKEEKNEEVKGLLIRSLEFFGREEIDELLIRCLEDKSEHVQASAIVVLGNLYSEKGMHALIKKLKKEKNKNIRIYMEDALKKIGI